MNLNASAANRAMLCLLMFEEKHVKLFKFKVRYCCCLMHVNMIITPQLHHCKLTTLCGLMTSLKYMHLFKNIWIAGLLLILSVSGSIQCMFATKHC